MSLKPSTTMYIPTDLNTVDSAGSQFIGLILNWGLFGLLVAQVFTYHTTFPNDTVIHKALVYITFLLEILQTVVITHDRYQGLVLHFGDRIAIEDIRLTWLAVPVLCGVIGCIAQVFYAHRIYKMSKSKILSGIILLLSVTQFVSGLIDGRNANAVKYFFHLRVKMLTSTAVWLLSTVACDILIATTMTYFLIKLKNEFCYSPFIITRLVSLTVETGIATASAATAIGILFIARPDSELFNIPAYMLAKLYSNSLLRVLNSRVLVGSGRDESFSIATQGIATSPVSCDAGRLPIQLHIHGVGEQHGTMGGNHSADS